MVPVDNSRRFLAGRRIYDLNGNRYLVLFGMSPFEENNYDILESRLKKSGINLGDFLTANVTAKNALKDFKKIAHPLDVKVEKHLAIMKFSSAELTRHPSGLVFKTRDFGFVRSVDQKLQLGSYEIVIKPRLTKSIYDLKEIKLYAKATRLIEPPVVLPLSLAYEVPTSTLKEKKHESVDAPKDSGYEYIIGSHQSTSEYLVNLEARLRAPGPSVRELVGKVEKLVQELNSAHSTGKTTITGPQKDMFEYVKKVQGGRKILTTFV